MKVHPVPERIVATRGHDARRMMPARSWKGLRRLPHVFNTVLQLPLPSDANVSVEESSACFTFVVSVSEDMRNVRAHVTEIHPGLVKVLIRDGIEFESDELELELDVWRFRLPPSTRPGLATAACSDGVLVVIVPKGRKSGIENLTIEDGDESGFWGDLSRLVSVQ